MPLPAQFNRITIENIYPELDGGKFAVKRVVGDMLEVWADIFLDGHGQVKAVLVVTPPGASQPIEIPMTHSGNDRWHAACPLTENGMYSYKIIAWPDDYGTWLVATQKKLAAGQDIRLEIQEGRALLNTIFGKPTKTQDKELAGLYKYFEQPAEELLKYAAIADNVAMVERYNTRPDQVLSRVLPVWIDRKLAEFGAWYEMFPRSQGIDPTKSATFDDCIARLPAIKKMGFDVVYLPPIHPIGEAFRKGKNNTLNANNDQPGSPYAIGFEDKGHKDIEPGLGTLDDFKRFVKESNALGMDVALDFAVQCSPDHPYVKNHPDWFTIRPDGSIMYAENPPKKYQDIVNFNFASADRAALWEELRSIVMFWIEQGVTIFRVDNPHTKPFAFWAWLIDTVRTDYPHIIFLAEAFTRPKVMYQLAKLGFTQSYSYFTWRNTKYELTQYLTELTVDWPKEFFRPNFFVNTPDIFPYFLQTSGRPGYMIRVALAATLGTTYGIYNGYELCDGEPVAGKEEYYNSEKYEFKVWDWDRPGNIIPFITQLNTIRAENSALHAFKNLKFYYAQNDQVIFYGKIAADKSHAVFVAVNLDPFVVQETPIEMPLWELGLPEDQPYQLDDLLLGHSWQWHGKHQHLHLDPQSNPVTIFRVRL